MTPQESQVLRDFLDQLVQVNGVVKDQQASELINKALSQQPDAAYLLVQRALLQERALSAAKSQIASLQRQLEGTQSEGGSFLDQANTWGNSARSVPRPTAQVLATGAQYPASVQPLAQAQAPGFLQGGGSFLGSMAATAAGVAGGAFLYQGIESLLGRHHDAAAIDQHGAADVPPEHASAEHFVDPDTGTGHDQLAADAGIDDIDTGGFDDGSS
jgi:uncharacterized protein